MPDAMPSAAASPSPSPSALMALKFELAMSIGESLDLAAMVRRFMVPLLQSVQGASALLWLQGDGACAAPVLLAYPQRSLARWCDDAEPGGRLAGVPPEAFDRPVHRATADGHVHALPVAGEGWLAIERRGAPIPDAVLQAITVVLRRLASACRACLEHERARRLLAEKQAAERALREANARMAEIFTLSSDGFAYFDAHGRLAFCNPAVEVLLGVATPSLMGLTLEQLDRRLAAGGAASELAARVAALPGAASCSGSLQLTQPQRRVVAYTLSRTEDDSRAVLYLRDVTRETEVDRMKSEFLTTAAHELRTPMVSVYGFTELLLCRPVPEAQRRDMLQTIHRQALRLIRMVNELLDLARIEARQGADLHRGPVDAGRLVHETIAGLQAQAMQHRLELELPADLPPLWADPAKTAQALGHVLGNAVKYSPPGSGIRIDSLEGRLGDAPALGLRVSDQGIGMNAQQAARVFERFYRADPSGNIPGTGLGMSLVKEIVELQGGRVEVASRPGQGTAVTLWLPLACETAGA